MSKNPKKRARRGRPDMRIAEDTREQLETFEQKLTFGSKIEMRGSFYRLLADIGGQLYKTKDSDVLFKEYKLLCWDKDHIACNYFISVAALRVLWEMLRLGLSVKVLRYRTCRLTAAGKTCLCHKSWYDKDQTEGYMLQSTTHSFTMYIAYRMEKDQSFAETLTVLNQVAPLPTEDHFIREYDFSMQARVKARKERMLAFCMASMKLLCSNRVIIECIFRHTSESPPPLKIITYREDVDEIWEDIQKWTMLLE